MSCCFGCSDRASGELLALQLMQRHMGTNIMREVNVIKSLL
jgi:hypothetical protein